MKIIFLDVDGVLNTHEIRLSSDWPPISGDHILILKRIIDTTNAKIVVSSDWRRRPENLSTLKEELAKFDIEILDCTPQTFGGLRSHEIKMWLQNNSDLGISDFVIIDDLVCASIDGHFFECNDDVGLTNEIADQIINRLENK